VLRDSSIAASLLSALEELPRLREANRVRLGIPASLSQFAAGPVASDRTDLARGSSFVLDAGTDRERTIQVVHVARGNVVVEFFLVRPEYGVDEVLRYCVAYLDACDEAARPIEFRPKGE